MLLELSRWFEFVVIPSIIGFLFGFLLTCMYTYLAIQCGLIVAACLIFYLTIKKNQPIDNTATYGSLEL